MVVRIMPYKILAYGHTDKGLVRENNEDVWGGVPELGFFALADGMGGHRAGEVASREAIMGLCQFVEDTIGQHNGITLDETSEIIRHIVEQVNNKIYQRGCSEDKLRGMGTTLCCIQFHEDGVVCAHVGDSRIYRLRDKKLEQLTEDHSLLRELIELGQIGEGEAPEFLYKHIITKAIGTEPNVEASVLVCDLVDSDIYMMCSDGLSDMLTQEEIETIMNREPMVEGSVRALIAKANEKGGVDNITVVAMQVQEYEEQDIPG